MCFIKKYASGISIDQIKTDLNIEHHEDFFKSKDIVKLKLGIIDDIDLIKEAFNLGLLVVDDFILKNIYHIVFGMAYNMYLDNIKNKTTVDGLQNIYLKVFIVYLCILKTHI
tara:strand:+ start:606 stop:941 length:336 start_codon:yes stop_codon:yes gene_type:complete